MRQALLVSFFASLLLGTLPACSSVSDGGDTTDDALTTDEVIGALGVDALEIELDAFPAAHDATPEWRPDADVRSWSMFYATSKQGFDGTLTVGVDAAGQVRYLIMVDGADPSRRVTMLRALDEPDVQAQAARDRSLRGSFGPGLDRETTAWIQSEFARMQRHLDDELGARDSTNGTVSTRGVSSAGVKCGLRIATWLAANVGGAVLGPVGYAAAASSEEAIWAFVDAAGSPADRAAAGAKTGGQAVAVNGSMGAAVATLEAAKRSGVRTLAAAGRAGMAVGGAGMVGVVVLVALHDDIVQGASVGAFVSQSTEGDVTVYTHADGGTTRVRRDTKNGTWIVTRPDGSTDVVPASWQYRFLPESCRRAFTTTTSAP